MQDLQSDLQLNDLRRGSSFRFSKLADAGAFGRFGDVEINNRGVTAFSGSSADSQDIAGIYTTRNGRNRETVIDTQSNLGDLFQGIVDAPDVSDIKYTIGDNVAINSQGDVAFEVKADFKRKEGETVLSEQVERLFLKQGSNFSTVGEAKASQPVSTPDFQRKSVDIRSFSLNDRDQVAYDLLERPTPGTGNTSIVSNGKTLASASASSIGAFVSNPVITNDGTVYYARITRGLRDQDNIFRVSSEGGTPSAVSSTPIVANEFSVNDQGTIVFSGSTREQGSGQFQLDSQGLKKLSTEGNSGEIDITNRGSIAAERPVEGQSAIVLDRNGQSTTVISANRKLSDRQVQEVDLGNVNDRNQVAFTTKFADGTVGLFRADLRRSFSPKVNLANDEIATPEEGEAEVALTT